MNLKNEFEIENMKEAGRIVGKAHKFVAEFIRPGLTTLKINDEVDAFIRDNRGYPTFLGAYDFPKSVCISVNEEVIHGIPSNRILKEGDLVKIDIGCTKNGFIGDSAWTYAIGEVSKKAKELMRIGESALYAGLKVLKDGTNSRLLSSAIENFVKRNKCSIVKDYCGHGVGRNLHELPSIPHYFNPKISSFTFKTNMTVAIEPMVNAGTSKVKVDSDNWTVVTLDKKLSVHYEHTVAVTDNGYFILTSDS